MGPPPLKKRLFAIALVVLMFISGYIAQHSQTDMQKGAWITVLIVSLLAVLSMMFENFD